MTDTRSKILDTVERHARGERPAAPEQYRPTAPPPAAGSDSVVTTFSDEATASDATVLRAATLTDAIDAMLPGLGESGAERIAVDLPANEMADARARLEAGGLGVVPHDEAIDALAAALASVGSDDTKAAADALSAFDAVLSVADAAIADTGTLVFRPASLGDRRLMALATHQVAIVRAERIFADGWAFEAQHEEAGDLLFVTGPSRTADIEKQIVLGAHGPSRLTIAVID